MKGSLFIVSAPSGAGKTTLCRMLLRETPNLVFSVSYTTRAPRRGEQDMKDYCFIGKDEFTAMAKRGEFLEWAEVHGNLYGTSRTRTSELLDSGRDVLLDIDVQGAAQIRDKNIDAVFIFILPPSMDILRERLTGRATDKADVIDRRLNKALEEIKDYYLYGYVIVNDRIEDALFKLKSVVIARRVSIDKVDHSWIKKTFGL